MPYLNIDEVDSAVAALATSFPNLTELVTLPEPSVEGRTSHALRISTATSASRDCVVMLGGVHAREWGSCEILVHLAADLLEAFQGGTGLGYGGTTYTADQVQGLLQRLDLVLFPLVNPDGRLYSQTVDPMWRKNRNPANSGGRSDPACVGVDINRNFDFLFDFATAFAPTADPHTSADPCDPQVYEGPSAFSEPETRNVRSVLEQFPGTRWLVDVHSYGGDILRNWGDDENQSTDPAENFLNPAFDHTRGLKGDLAYAEFIEKTDSDNAVLLAEGFCQALNGVRGVTYTPEQGFQLYPTSGTSDDYAFSRHFVNPDQGKVLGFTVEWGQGFQPDWTEMERIILDVDAGLVGFCLATA
ncbi:M14 family metallopeptidase [Kitasatospora sp. NPDC001660]